MLLYSTRSMPTSPTSNTSENQRGGDCKVATGPAHLTWSGGRIPVNWNLALERRYSGRNSAGQPMPKALSTSKIFYCAVYASVSFYPTGGKCTCPESARYARENLAGTMHAGSKKRKTIWNSCEHTIASLIQQRFQTGTRCSQQPERKRPGETLALRFYVKQQHEPNPRWIIVEIKRR